MLPPWKKSYDKPRQCIKKQSHNFANKGSYSQNYGFSSSHIWIWELDHKEGWTLKNWCLLTVVLVNILESPLHCKEFIPINSKYNQPWIFIWRTDAQVKHQYFGHLMQRGGSLVKTLLLVKIEGRWRNEIDNEKEIAR